MMKHVRASGEKVRKSYDSNRGLRNSHQNSSKAIVDRSLDPSKNMQVSDSVMKNHKDGEKADEDGVDEENTPEAPREAAV